MTLKHNYNIMALVKGVVMMTLTAFLTTACGDDKNEGGAGGANSVVWDMEMTIKPDSEGAAVLEVTGREGTGWTAEITSGEEWVSFNRSAPGGQTVKTGEVGTSLAARTQYVYYWPNTTRNDRTATIRFTFAGQEPVELEMVQFSTNSGQNVYTAGWNRAWPEIPAEGNKSLDAGNFIYVTHFGPVYNEAAGKNFTGRNFTLCFDKTKRGSWWVAYPMHKTYLGSGRPSKDPWAFDPKIASSFQADLARGGYNRSPAFSYSFDRGHQIPNADRNANTTMQYQTFYNSNATPQASSLNQGPWVQLEGKIRDWKCSDTLYVVTGAYWRPGSTASTTDKAGQNCPLPTSYFKVVVRTKSGATGKRLQDCAPSELKSLGFWVPENAPNQGQPRSWATSVKEIEDKTGFTFFPDVPAEVKSMTETASWGL